MNKLRVLATAIAVLFSALSIFASEYYVAPSGSPSGNGSKERPWDLTTALAQPPAVKPGDTIWLRGGTYVGHYASKLRGSQNKPIVVRQFAGERATLDGNDGTTSVTLVVDGSDTWFWGFEVTNSNSNRTSSNANPVPGRGEAINLLGARTRLINLALHDTSQGVLTTTDIPDTEVSGCLIYYNGYDGTDRGHGHGIYIQNAAPSVKHLYDNVIFDQFGIGIHAYTESGKLDNLDFEGNTSFNNGALSTVTGLTTDILVGANGSPAANAGDSAKVAKNTTLKNNYTYFSGAGGTAMNLGFSKGIASPVLVDNYVAGGAALVLSNAFRPITMTGNSLYGALTGFQSSEFPSNTYYTARPTGVKFFVRQNRYEPGRANITIYNWDKAPTVDVDVHGAIMPGTHYELRDAQNFFGPPVLSGVYTGAPLHVPMAALAPATPVGRPAPPSTGPEFQVFVLLPTAPPSASRGAVHRPTDTARLPATVQRSIADRAPALAASTFFPGVRGGLDRAVPDSPAAGALDGPCATATFATARAASAGRDERSSDSTTLYFGAVVASRGAAGCRTSFSARNHGGEPALVSLAFLEHDREGGGAPTASFVLGPGESRHADDVLAAFFGLEETYGAIELETDSPYVRALATTISESPPAERLDRGIAAGRPTVSNSLSGLAVDQGNSGHVLLVNPGLAGAVVSLTLLGSETRPSETTFVVVPPRACRRQPLASLFPAAAAGGELLSVAFDAGGLPILALGPIAEADRPPRPAGPSQR